MLDISGILRKYKEGKDKLKLEEANKNMDQEQPSEEYGVRVSSAVNKERKEDDAVDTNALYEEIVSKVRGVYKLESGFDPNFILDINDLVEKIADSLNSDNRALLIASLADYPKSEEYLYYHVANVCVICIYAGIALNYEHRRLNELGVSSFLHDIGMTRCLDLANKNRTLNTEEYECIKEHPNKGMDILNKVGGLLSRRIIDAAQQEHERMDGSGYPRGLKDEHISEDARVVGLVDVYEAMMHRRPYRARFTSLETIKTILNNKHLFDANIVKILIERIGIFPIGAIVRLNNREVGVVVKDNQKLPLRPTVKILFDAMGKELAQAKQIDLAENSIIYIEESLNEYPKKAA